MKFAKVNWLLVAVLTLAIILRLYKLSSIPIGFNDDEAAFGYNAYSILATGRDEWGRPLPFPVFESFGDWKLVGYLYPVVLSQFIFGTNEFATRLPSAIFGILAPLATYLLAKKLFDKKIALLAAFFLAISPWHIVASRNAFESDPLIFFISLATYFLMKARKSINYLYLSVALFGTSLYFYRSSWLFVPLFTLSTFFFFKNEIKYRIFAVKIILLVLAIVLSLAPAALTFRGQSRFFQESLVSGVAKSGIVDDVNTRRGTCPKNWPQAVCILSYNQYLFYFSTYANNYISNLSPETYFIRGNPGGYQSFSIRSLFYTFELPLLMVGIFLLIVQKHQAAKILIPWILIVPIGASITGVGNPGRLNILMPSVQIVAAFGLYSILSFIKQNRAKIIFGLAIFVIILASFWRLVMDMFIYYPQVSGVFQRYGYKELFGYLQSQKNNYNQIIVSRAADDAKQYIHYLFFEKIDPRTFHSSNLTIKYRTQDLWQEVEQIGNFKFTRYTPDLAIIPPKSLLAVAHNQILHEDLAVFRVLYPNGDTAFEVYDVDYLRAKIQQDSEK